MDFRYFLVLPHQVTTGVRRFPQVYELEWENRNRDTDFDDDLSVTPEEQMTRLCHINLV